MIAAWGATTIKAIKDENLTANIQAPIPETPSWSEYFTGRKTPTIHKKHKNITKNPKFANLKRRHQSIRRHKQKK